MRSPDPGFSHSLAGQPAAPGRNPGGMFLPGGWQEKFTAQLLPKWSFSGSQPPAPEPGEGTRKQPPSCHRSEVCANGSALTPVFNKLKMLLEYFYNWSVHTFVLSSARLVFLQPRFPAAGFAGAFFFIIIINSLASRISLPIILPCTSCVPQQVSGAVRRSCFCERCKLYNFALI